MSHLLMQWLNDEIQLSRKVANLEHDFSNGYLFGELLSKYNQQLNFSEFKNSELRDAKINNFNLLLPTFKTLKIKFNTQTVNKVITQTPGLAEQLLYSLKMALEKVNDPADVLIHAKTGKYNAIVPLKCIQQPKEQYDKMESLFFERRLNEMNRAQKMVNQDTHLGRFENFKQQQDQKIMRFKNKDETEQRTLKEEMRKIQLNKLQRNMAFMEDWNQKGIENWKKNQELRHKNLQTDMQFNARQEEKRQNRLQYLNDQTRAEMVEQITWFEGNLQRNEHDEEEEGPPQELSQALPALGTVTRIHQSKVLSEFLRKERDKRRRKMIVDQAKQHGELARREKAVLEKINQQSKQEQEILYEVWRAYQCKSIISQDRGQRDEKYKQKQELNVINIKYKEEEMLKIIRAEYREDLGLQMVRERELRIECKLHTRKANYEQCRSLVEQLFELAEQCQEYLQNADVDSIGEAFLDECNKLFIAGKPLPPAKRFRTFDPIPQLKLQSEFPEAEDQKQYLATMELQDYINGAGLWQPHHSGEGNEETMDDKFIPSKPLNNYYLGNLVRLLIEGTPANERPQTKHRAQMPMHLPFRCALIGYAFCGKRSIADLLARKYGITVVGVESVVTELMEYYRRWQEHERMLQQPQRLGSPEELSRLNTESRQQIESKAQTQTVGRFSQQSRRQLDSEAEQRDREPSLREPSQRDPSQREPSQRSVRGSAKNIDEPGRMQSRSKSRISQRLTNQGGQPVITETFWDQEMLAIAKNIHDVMLQGIDVPEQLLVQAISLKLRHLFANKSSEECYQDYLKSREDPSKHGNNASSSSKHFDGEEQSELELIHREDFHKRNMINQRYPYCQGFLLYDFPHSYSQAKLLEQFLTGMQPVDEIPKSEVDQRLEQAALVVKPSPVRIVPREPIAGGLPLVMYLQMDSNESSLKRALGRRYDAYTHSVYHLEDNPPPVDNAPLVERLQQVSDINNMEQQISDKNTYFDQEIDRLQGWYSNFAHRTYQTVQKEVEVQLGIEAQPAEAEEEQVQQQAPQVQIQTVQERIPKQLSTFQTINSNRKIEDVFYSADQLIQQMLEISELQVLNAQQERERQQVLAIQEAEAQKQLAELDAKWLPTESTVVVQLLGDALHKSGLSQPIAEHLHNFWQYIQNMYLRQSRLFFRKFKDQRELILTRLMDLQLKFIDMITRHDEKFFLARNYQVYYNSFVDENPDMMEEEQTKEELHQRVEDLSDTLADLIDQKRDDALEERRKTMESQWVENELERFLLEVQRLLQSELDRTLCSIHLINDYYTQLDGREWSEPPEAFQIEIAPNPETLPPVEQADDPNTFPRLDKLLFDTLRILNGEEEVVVDDKGKKGGKVAKKEDKKAPAKKGVKEVEEVKREPTPLELEGLKAIATEKAILRYRVYVIRDAAIRTLKDIRFQARRLYQKMEEWSHYTHKVQKILLYSKCEMEAVGSMCSLFRQAIEEEQKIQKEIQLEFVDVRISHEMLNFFTPVPPPLTAREPTNGGRLSVSQLYHLIEDLRAITSSQMAIEVKQLMLVLTRKGQGLQKEDLCDTLRVQKNDWLRVLAKLQNNGYVPVRTICTYFILLTSPILDHIERKEYQNALQDGGSQTIDRQGFIETQAWFDSYESIPEEDNTNYFDRAVYIKELLFFVHKDPDTEMLHIPSFLDVLQIRDRGQAATYYEYLFSV